jgi:Ca-activated chloride channel family protein
MQLRYQWQDPSQLRRRDRLDELRRLFRELLLIASGDVEQALRWLQRLAQRNDLWPPGMDIEGFRALLQRDGEVRQVPGARRLALTTRGERSIRKDALERMFGDLDPGAAGSHTTPDVGAGPEPTAETRPFEPGDDLALLDWNRTFHNAVLRTGGRAPELRSEDLEVRETERRTSCATVLLLDISHSMVLYGEDRITPAKKVALALAELITTRYPKDLLEVVLFGDDARRVPLERIPYVQVGPFHTNTRAGLRMARSLLERSKAQNRRVFMITDGKPSALTEADGTIYKNPMGLDTRIVNKTLEEAPALRRKGITVTTFMIASDPYLVQFVEEFTRLNHGRAYYSDPEKVGSYLFVDYVRNRRRRV